MKVVYFNYLYDSHQDSVGASVHVKEFVNAMQACGLEIKSYNLNPTPFSANGKLHLKNRIREALKKKLKRYVGQVNQLLRNVPLFFREWKILVAEQPDALLVRYNLLNFSAPLAAKIKGIPVVLEVNSPHAFERKHLVKDVWQIPLLPFLIEWLNLKLADRVITVSNALKRYYVEKKLSPEKISVVPNGVNTGRFSPQISSNRIRDKYNFQDRIVLGFVGSFHYWHGIDNLLKLIEYTLPKYSNVAYLLVGDGPLKNDMESFVKNRHLDERVILTGYVPHDDVPFYVAAMDIVLAPYPASDFFYFSPLKLFEYLAAGKAVIASNIGQIAELIRDNENGVLYNPENLDDLFKRTSQVIENAELRNCLAQNGRRSVVDSYSWQNNARKVAEVLCSTLESHRN